jgi:phage gpG-like protein
VLNVHADTDDVLRGLKKLQDNLKDDTSKKLEIVGVFLESKMTEKIDMRLRPPLKASTIAYKKSSQPLFDTGEMYDQIDHKLGENSVEVGVFGSRASIARHHEFGAPRANIPERSFMRSAFAESKRKIVKMMKR